MRLEFIGCYVGKFHVPQMKRVRTYIAFFIESKD